MKTNKRVVPEWEQDAIRLKELFEQRSNKLTQTAFGKKHGIGTQGMMSQYLNGKAPLTKSAANKFAIGLGVSIAEFSPRLSGSMANANMTRVPVTIQLKPEIRGKMIQIAGARSCSGKAVPLYEIYEEALLEFLIKQEHILL